MNSQTRIYHIFDDDDIAVLYRLLERYDELQLTGRSHPVIGADTHKRLFTADVLKRPNEVSRKDKRAVEHDHKKRFFTSGIVAN